MKTTTLVKGVFSGSVLASLDLTHTSARLHVTETVSDEACTCENGKAKIWGPGGPHTALVPVAELFNARVNKSTKETQTTKIEICWGPESTWRTEALRCASGLMAAAEQQTAGFARVYSDVIDASGGYGSIGEVLTMHKAVLLVPTGNPKQIAGLDDILARDDVTMVTVDGNLHGTLTSGTALWEDVVGRTAQLKDMVDLRSKICYVASGAGDARNHLIDEASGCDSWIYWEDWAVANPSIVEAIDLPSDLEIFRGLTVVSTMNPGGNVVDDFVTFALNSTEANEAMEAAGWYRSYD